MRHNTLNLRGNLFSLQQPQVMGIINVTPDSFFADSRKQDEHAIRQRIQQIVNEGGTMVDVGGCSTRPGSTMPTAQEEMQRLRMPLTILRNEFPLMPVSVDTFRADVAKEAVLQYGAHIINDVSGGTEDSQMMHTVAQLQVPYVLMHLRGGINGMHVCDPYHPNVETAVLDFFIKQVDALRSKGVADIILDPGYGFGKTPQDNYRLLAQSGKAFSALQLPILTGISRKRMIWQTLEGDPSNALNGTTVLNTIALIKGSADILRVHDVKAAVEAVKLVNMLQQNTPNEPQNTLFNYTHNIQ